MATVPLSAEATNKNAPLDFSSVKGLPDSHAWWSKGCPDNINTSVSIPTVDLADPNAMEAIGAACEEWGIFQIKNHGIPLSLLREVDEEIKHLFSLPTEQKLQALRRPGSANGYGRGHISYFFDKSFWQEGFTIIDSSYEDAKKILTEDDLVRFCETMEKFQKQLAMVTEKVTGFILELLGASEEERNYFKRNNVPFLQMNSYPSCPDPDKAIGFAPHKDTSIVTFLHQTLEQAVTENELQSQDRTRGLQIFKEGLGWVPVQPDPDVFVANVGDIVEILSNGRFPSVLHRVTVSGTSHRYSYAYFRRPPADTLLAPFASPPRFRALTLSEFDALNAKDRFSTMASITIN